MLETLRKHMKVVISTFAAITILTLGVLISTQNVLAAPVDVLQQCNSQSAVCKGTNGNSLYTLIARVISLLILIIGIISVIMIIIGGIRYTTSAGDAGQTKSARDTIIYAVVGLVIAIMSYALVNFVLNQLK